MKRIVTFGEILLRWSKGGALRLSQGDAWEGQFGGSEANVAVALSILGNRVGYVSRIPANAIGQACLNKLRYYGIDVSDVVRGGERLGTYYFERAADVRRSLVIYDRNGSSFYSAAPGMFPWRDIFSRTDIFHCSGITCAVSRSATDATFEAVRTAKEMGLRITCDINYRRNLWKYEGADAHRTLNDLMQYSDFIFGDQDEWEVATGVPKINEEKMMADSVLDMDAYRRYFDEMHRQFPNCHEMMLGLRNQLTTNHHTLTALLWYGGEIYTTRIWDITHIVDSVGVGDAFVSAYIHAAERWKGDPQRGLDFATAAAMMKNSVVGDFNLVTEEEILEQLED
ncbi:MAG: sugar kinase [Bacteroidales bacterium]|nr:sugar kinase [Bacteroidales bacterium]